MRGEGEGVRQGLLIMLMLIMITACMRSEAESVVSCNFIHAISVIPQGDLEGFFGALEGALDEAGFFSSRLDQKKRESVSVNIRWLSRMRGPISSYRPLVAAAAYVQEHLQPHSQAEQERSPVSEGDAGRALQTTRARGTNQELTPKTFFFSTKAKGPKQLPLSLFCFIISDI